MAEFTIDGATYETDNLDDTQKRVIALYQKALSEEAESAAALEMKRAARIELGRKLKELVIDKKDVRVTQKEEVVFFARYKQLILPVLFTVGTNFLVSLVLAQHLVAASTMVATNIN